MLYGFRKTGMSTGSHIRHATAERGTARFIAAIPDDPHHMLVSISTWDSTGYERALPVAYRMDVRTGDKVKTMTAPMRGASFVADHHGHIRFAWALANDDSFNVYAHPADGDGWQLLPKVSAGRSTPMAFTTDDSAAYFRCPAAPGFGICRWDPTKQVLQPVWSNATVEPDGLLQGLAEDSIIGVSFMNGRAGLALFDNQSADAQALMMLMKQIPGESVQFVSGTRDGRLSVVLVQADADPGAFYLFDPMAKKLTQLLSRASWIKPEQMAIKEPLEFAARDGLKLQGYVSYPPGRENAKHLPMVVFVHARPEGTRSLGLRS